MTTGRITLPVPEPQRAYLRSIRRARSELSEVIDAVSAAEVELTNLKVELRPPDEPDRRWVDRWLHRSHLRYWDQLEAS